MRVCEVWLEDPVEGPVESFRDDIGVEESPIRTGSSSHADGRGGCATRSTQRFGGENSKSLHPHTPQRTNKEEYAEDAEDTEEPSTFFCPVG